MKTVTTNLQTGQVLVGTIVASCLSEDNIKNYPDWLICNGDPVPDGYELKKHMQNTPNLCGRTLIGTSDKHIFNTKGGSEIHLLTNDEMPMHNHYGWGESYKDWPFGNGGDSKAGKMGSKGGKDNNNYYYNTSSTGGNEAHNNMQPYHVVHYIVYAKKI